MNATVTIISIWSKWEGLEGKLAGRDQNFQYDVQVPYEGDNIETQLDAILEGAFVMTNMDDRPNGNRCCSTTSGDIMVVNGIHFLVSPCGFNRLTVEESEAIQKLSSRDTSFGLDWMRRKGLLTPAAVN